jgi:hypothetical protein
VEGGEEGKKKSPKKEQKEKEDLADTKEGKNKKKGLFKSMGEAKALSKFRLDYRKLRNFLRKGDMSSS